MNTPKGMLEFADHLADTGDFYRAITEYKRALFYFPNYDKKEWIQFEIGKNYFMGGRMSQAKDWFIPLTAEQNRLGLLANNWLALTYFEAEEFVNSERLFSELKDRKDRDVPASDYYLYIMMSRFYQKKFKEAFSDHQNLLTTMDKKKDILLHKFLDQSRKPMQEAAQLDKKSTTIAVILGIILPGAGHLYLGEWDNALVSFLLVGSMGILAYDGFARNSPVQAGIFTTLGTGFYAGSIYSAYRQTQKFNIYFGDVYIREVKSHFREFNISITQKLRFN